ncbi:MAG: amidohydrolase family protein, partial [Bacteroidales bacterium]|nr:amidohydrolase family protein [Bacteroidales bacterium]
MNVLQKYFAFFLLLGLALNAFSQSKSIIWEISSKALYDPDIILHNANVITMDDLVPHAQAIAIAGNRITAVGTDAEILAIKTDSTQMIDLGGRTVTPGLIEAHDHGLHNGYQENGVEGLRRATERMAAMGYTTVHQLFCWEDFVAAAQELAQNDELAVRINFYVPYNTNCNTEGVPLGNLPYTEKRDTTVRVVGIKIFADGGTCGFSSAVSKPYQVGDPNFFGDLFKTEAEMNSIVKTVIDAGYPIAMHAIGDSAIGVGLNAFENAFAGQGNKLRCRMEHLRVMREDLADQMASLGIAASIQYTRALARRASYWQTIYLPSVLAWVYPWRRMADRGIPIVGGNDFPYAQGLQSMQTLSYLATRKSAQSDTLAAWMDRDKLTVEVGLKAMTQTNAWVVFEEEVKGSIVAGKLADLTVLSEDPLAIDPYDVRKIKIEMTLMDGKIRHNRLNKKESAIHDAGTFSINIDDRGLWGPERSQVGLLVEGIEQLHQGSMLVSYDTNTIATATYLQQDYASLPEGYVDFQEPGLIATEEATVIYEDVSTFHPNSLIIEQKSFMWEEDPLLLVNYAFRNQHDHDISNIYLGQFMSINITGSGIGWTSHLDDMAGWEENNGLGFAYMYDNDQTTPYIGISMFDETGKHITNSLTFNAGYRIDKGWDEQVFSEAMRSGIIETEASTPGSYTILTSSGPFSIDRGQSISPFTVAFLVGENLSDLKTAANLAYQRSILVTSDRGIQGLHAGDGPFLMNYPNPFKGSTTISFTLHQAEHVRLQVFNFLGQKVIPFLNQ